LVGAKLILQDFRFASWTAEDLRKRVYIVFLPFQPRPLTSQYVGNNIGGWLKGHLAATFHKRS